MTVIAKFTLRTTKRMRPEDEPQFLSVHEPGEAPEHIVLVGDEEGDLPVAPPVRPKRKRRKL